MIEGGGILDLGAIATSAWDRVDESWLPWLILALIIGHTLRPMLATLPEQIRLWRKDRRDAERQDLRLRSQIQDRRRRSREKRKGAQK